MVKKKKSKKEEVKEIFKVEKPSKGTASSKTPSTSDSGEPRKEKIVEAKGEITPKEKIKEKVTKKQISNENKLLLNILIVLGLLLVSFIGGYFFIESQKHFEYRGIEFDVVDEIAPYRTNFPAKYQGKNYIYNFYLRNDPRDLDDIPFGGKINFADNIILEVTTEDLFCEGYWTISIGNVAKLYNFLGFQVGENENLSCDKEGRYMHVQINEAEETNIKQVGEKCYEINVNNCEILEATEKFMMETFVEATEQWI